MNARHPFNAADLEELDNRLLSVADRVVPMRDIYKGDCSRRVIGLRHDVDDNPGAFDTALEMARWECDHGYSSTYFLLHGSRYWTADNLVRALELEDLGHEVGIHVNAIADSLRHPRSPDWILAEALGDIRSVGLRVEGSVAHGDPLCRDESGDVWFVNDEIFAECRREDMGDVGGERVSSDPPGLKKRVWIDPRPRGDYHLAYDANWLPRGNYLSDSGGVWSQPFDKVCAAFGAGQLHVLIHPDWWSRAFDRVAA